MSNDNLVPEPQPSVFDAVNGVLQDEEAARRVMANPALAKGFPNGRPIERSAASGDDNAYKIRMSFADSLAHGGALGAGAYRINGIFNVAAGKYRPIGAFQRRANGKMGIRAIGPVQHGYSGGL